MRIFVWFFVFVGLTTFCGLKLYEKYGPDSERKAEAVNVDDTEEDSLAYPDELELESVDGRLIQVTLLGRNESYIQFDRVSDSKRFVYPIDQLTPDSQAQVKRYPDVGIADAGTFVASGQIELGDAYVEQLRLAISRIETKVRDLELQASRSQSKTEQRTIQRELEDLEKEKQTFLSKISERQ